MKLEGRKTMPSFSGTHIDIRSSMETEKDGLQAAELSGKSQTAFKISHSSSSVEVTPEIVNSDQGLKSGLMSQHDLLETISHANEMTEFYRYSLAGRQSYIKVE